MAKTIFWDPNTKSYRQYGQIANPWDIVTIGTDTLPGICTVDAKAKHKVKSKGKSGKDGNTPTSSGINPIEFQVVCTIWTKEQLDQLDTILDKIWPKPGKTKATSNKEAAQNRGRLLNVITHPKLAQLNISQAMLVGISTLEDGKAVGAKKMTFEFLQSIESNTNAVSTPKGATLNPEPRSTPAPGKDPAFTNPSNFR